MALQDNSIGANSFITLLGQIVPPSPVVLTEDRPGVDGTEFILAGNKGRPFSLISQVDCANYTAAMFEFHAAYLPLKAAVPVTLVQGGILFLAHGYMFKVIDVQLLRCLTIRGAVGNRLSSTPYEGFLECRWDLVAVPI